MQGIGCATTSPDESTSCQSGAVDGSSGTVANSNTADTAVAATTITATTAASPTATTTATTTNTTNVCAVLMFPQQLSYLFQTRLESSSGEEGEVGVD